MNGHSAIDIDEDEDELLYEVDVHLHRPEQSLYLFQYPIRPNYRTYDESSFTNARMKEKFSLVEMDLFIDPQSSNYFSSRGKQFADSAINDHGKPFFNSDRMDKQTIASTNSSNGKLQQNCDIVLLDISQEMSKATRIEGEVPFCFFRTRITSVDKILLKTLVVSWCFALANIVC